MNYLPELLDPALPGALVLDVGPPLLPGFIARDDEFCSLELHRASLDLQRQRVPVHDTQHEVVAYPAVELVDDYLFLAVIAVEPDCVVTIGFCEDVRVRVFLEGLAGLARAGLAPPDMELRASGRISGACEGRAGCRDPGPVAERDRGALLEQREVPASVLQEREGALQVVPRALRARRSADGPRAGDPRLLLARVGAALLARAVGLL